MDLSTLRPSITRIDWQAQLSIHERIRVSRLIRKAVKTKAIKKKVAKKRTKINTLKKLTPLEAQAILNKMKEMDLPDTIKQQLEGNTNE